MTMGYCEGLEQLTPDALGNLEILSNNALSDISALSKIMQCNSTGQTTIRPSTTLVGSIETLPKNSDGTEHCLLSTVGQVQLLVLSPQCGRHLKKSAYPVPLS